MAQVTAQMVKELRDRTLVGMADCKNALVEADGDVEKAIEVLRKKESRKRQNELDNATSEAKIVVAIDGGAAYIAAVSCETDFVSRNEVFGGMVDQFIDILKKQQTKKKLLLKQKH